MREPAWTLIAPHGIPLPLEDVGALSDGEAVVLAHGGLYRWNGHGTPVSICDATDDPPAMIEAEGDRFVALGGDEGAPVVWISDDRGASCEHVALPPLLVARTPPGELGLSLDNTVALAWSTSGAVARSEDGGHTWRRLPALTGVVRVNPGPGGTTLAAARMEPAATEPEGSRVRLYRLTPGALRWAAVPGASERRLPLVFQTLGDGTVRVVDGLGTATVGVDGALHGSSLDAAYRNREDVPRVLQRAGAGECVGFTQRLLTRVDDHGSHAFAVLPGPRAPRMIDAAADGTVWVGNGLALWRGARDGALEEVTRRPFGEELPVAMAAHGNVLAVVTDGGRLHRSVDGGEHWARQRLPPGLGGALAMTFDPRGTLLILGAGGLAASDGDAVVLTELPARTGAPARGASVTVLGDRWIVADGNVLTSDDQGAHWTQRPVTEEASHGVIDRVTAVAFHGGTTGYALLASHALLRTDDGASSFHAVEAAASWTSLSAVLMSQQSLAWDGAGEIAVLGRMTQLRSHDGGAHFEAVEGPLAARLATFLPDGTLAAVAEASPLVVSSCRAWGGGALLMETRNGWTVPPGSCQHRGQVFALDGLRLYIVDAAGTLWRASLEAVAREGR